MFQSIKILKNVSKTLKNISFKKKIFFQCIKRSKKLFEPLNYLFSKTSRNLNNF